MRKGNEQTIGTLQRNHVVSQSTGDDKACGWRPTFL